MRNLYTSARGNYRLCKYYVRDERDSIGDLSVWVLKNRPTGEFYAVETQSVSNQSQQANNVFLYDSNNITLKTTDKVDDLTRGCVILYLNHSWMVDSVQRQIIERQTEFTTELEYITYISIRR